MTRIPYPFRFRPDDHAAIRGCLVEHGFAVVEAMLGPALVDHLKRGTEEACAAMGRNNETWASLTCLNFVEASPAAEALMRHRPYLDLVHHLLGTEDICLHRSACIRRRPGQGVVNWHTDRSDRPADQPAGSVDDILNTPKPYLATSCWFYLTGSRPSHGGLSVIPDSHRPDWQPPAGFRFVHGRKTFNRIDGPEEPYAAFDVPGALAVETRPGDAILFDLGTYHAAEANSEAETRLSCGVGFRPQSVTIEAPWAWPESAHALRRRLPADLQPYLDGYPSIVPGWSSQPAEPASAAVTRG